MKKEMKTMRLYVSALLISCSLGFTSCSDDDKTPTQVTTEDVYGAYEGRMMTSEAAALDNDTPSSGIRIQSEIQNDTIHFQNFPIKDIVLSIVGDENTANSIVEAVGNVSYQIGYKPAIAAAQDSIFMKLVPQSLKLKLAMPPAAEGEDAQDLAIEVRVETLADAAYAVADGHLQFAIHATEVLLGEGESQNPFPGFTATTFEFDMNQHRVVHNR